MRWMVLLVGGCAGSGEVGRAPDALAPGDEADVTGPGGEPSQEESEPPPPAGSGSSEEGALPDPASPTDLNAGLEIFEQSCAECHGETLELMFAPLSFDAIVEQVGLRTEGCRAARQMTASRPLKQWQALGVRAVNGKALPAADRDASLFRAGKRAFLVYHNYEALLGYNCAHAYALAVSQLADRVRR